MIEFAGLKIELPTAWCDVSDELPPGSPATLAREDGVGVIQFTVYRYGAGQLPHITEAALRDMLIQFCVRQGLQIAPEPVPSAKALAVGGISRTGDDVTAVWYLSDGLSAAMLTYVADISDARRAADELRDVEAIVKSATFAPEA